MCNGHYCFACAICAREICTYASFVEISIYLLKLTLKWTKQHMNVLDADEWWHHHLAVMSFRHPCRGSNQHWNNAFQLATNKFQLQIWWICIVSISSTVNNKKNVLKKLCKIKEREKEKKMLKITKKKQNNRINEVDKMSTFQSHTLIQKIKCSLAILSMKGLN